MYVCIGNTSVLEERRPPPISRIPSMVSLGSFRSNHHHHNNNNEVGLALVRPPNAAQPLSRNNSTNSLMSLLLTTSSGRRPNIPSNANLTQRRSDFCYLFTLENN